LRVDVSAVELSLAAQYRFKPVNVIGSPADHVLVFLPVTSQQEGRTGNV
jgi:hypothetical protein